MTTYTYSPLVGMTSQTDVGNRVTYYEYDGLQRLKRIRDQDYNILKTYEYQYQVPAGCNGCQSVAMETFLGTNTLGYPVGVFDIHGNLVGNAAGASAYVSLWNSDTADARVGTLSTGNDSLHFNIVLNAGQTLPASVTGCRYYQMDMTWSQIDAVRPFNGTYIDFGDTTGMRMNPNPSDTPITIAPNTTLYAYYDNAHFFNTFYIIHTYHDTSLKTITCYHNDAAEDEDFDNINNPATGLTRLKNLRGNLPANTTYIGGSCYQQPTMTSLANIANWSSINTIQYFRLNFGDGINPCENISYPQDFLANDHGLLNIQLDWAPHQAGNGDSTFKLSRLKSDWNTYFTQLQGIAINEDDWNHEDLSGLHYLNAFTLYASSQVQSIPSTPLVPLGQSEIDSILIQIWAGAGQTVSNGRIHIVTGGTTSSSASAFASSQLISKGWAIVIDTTTR
jgi:YD repeat-containing protein